MVWLLISFALGVLATVPLILLAAHRTKARVLRAERRAQTAERLAELGTLTGGLAHEIKNPLSTVGLNVQLLQEDLGDLSRSAADRPQLGQAIGRIQRRFDALARETSRLREILEDFLRFAGRLKLDLAPTDINTMITELIDFYAPQAEMHQIQLRSQLENGPLEAPADAGLLKQALLNLLINATQAMTEAREKGLPHGGARDLIVRTSRSRDEVQIHVTDTGPGIPEDRVGKVFQPYFSTKRGGTGLGLPTTRRIVEEHGGAITFHTEPNQGTDFIITLPIEPVSVDQDEGEGVTA